MRHGIFVFFALLGMGMYGLQEVEASPKISVTLPERGKHYERVVLKYLWAALNYGEKIGRIYYGDVCQPNDDFAAAFPRLNVRPPSNGKTGVAAVREIFRNVKDVSIKEAEPDIIRVKIGNVSNAILRVRIATLVFTPEEQYNYWPAIFKIQNTREVRSAMQELKLRLPARVFNIGIVQPADGLPHLPTVLTDVTMDQALDLVARTFGGVVLYKFCTPPDQYEVGFANARDIYSTMDD